jgi:hypothetical protein
MDNRCGTVAAPHYSPRTRGKHGRNLRHFPRSRLVSVFSESKPNGACENVLSYTAAFIVGHDNLAADVIEDAYLVVGTENGKQAAPGLPTDDRSHGNGNTVVFLRTSSVNCVFILIRNEFHCASHRIGPPTKEVAGSSVVVSISKWLLLSSSCRIRSRSSF